MAKKKRVNQKSARQQHLVPSRHNIAKQSAAVLALGLGLAAVGPVEASIVHTTVNQTINSGETLDFLNVFGGNQFTLSLVPGYAQVGYSPTSNVSYVMLNPTYYPSWFAAKLPSGTSIPTGYYQKYGYLVAGTSGGWTDGLPGYVGLTFSDGTDAFYGWAQVSVATDLASLKLIDFAYETEANTPIEAGAVPLPGSLALMATGAAGLLAYRRMKRAA